MCTFDSALEHYNRAMYVSLSIHGYQHATTATAYHNVGTVFNKQNLLDKALYYFEHSLNIRLQVLGAHTDTAISYNSLGSVFNKQCLYERALDAYQRDLDICLAQIGPAHPDTAVTHCSIGLVLYNMERYEDAQGHFAKALDINEDVLGPRHLKAAGVLNHMGNCQVKLGNLKQARELLSRCLDIDLQQLGPTHLHTAIAQRNLAKLCALEGDFAACSELCSTAASTIKGAVGERDYRVGQVLFIQGLALKLQGQFDAAIRVLEESVSMLREARGVHHADTIEVESMLVELYLATGKIRQANALANTSLQRGGSARPFDRHHSSAAASPHTARSRQRHGAPKE